MGYISRAILFASLLIGLAACQHSSNGHEFRTWLEANHYILANDSTALIVEYTVSDCLNCDYRINGFVHDLQQRYSVNDSNVIVVVDYRREMERPQIKQVLFQLFKKDFQLIQKEKIKEYLNNYKASIIKDATYIKGNAQYYVLKL